MGVPVPCRCRRKGGKKRKKKGVGFLCLRRTFEEPAATGVKTIKGGKKKRKETSYVCLLRLVIVIENSVRCPASDKLKRKKGGEKGERGRLALP